MNFLLPHIRRMPNALHRSEFANDAAQKLGIDSALLRAGAEAGGGAADGEHSRASRRAADGDGTHPAARAGAAGGGSGARACGGSAWPSIRSGLRTSPRRTCWIRWRTRPRRRIRWTRRTPTKARAHLALALDHSPHPSDAAPEAQVEGALHTLELRRLQRRQRELRTQIAEADRRGDQAMLAQLVQEKVSVDRQLRNH